MGHYLKEEVGILPPVEKSQEKIDLKHGEGEDFVQPLLQMA